MQQAINKLWRFTAELFDTDEIDIALVKRVLRVDPRTLRATWEARSFCWDQRSHIERTAKSRRIALAVKGLHTEHLGPMLAKCSISPACLARSAW